MKYKTGAFWVVLAGSQSQAAVETAAVLLFSRELRYNPNFNTKS